MIDIRDTDVTGWEAAIRGMRNPMNSWEKSDSTWCPGGDVDPLCDNCPHCKDEGDDCTRICYNLDSFPVFVVGDNDLKLMKTLGAAGTDHGKYLRMITVTADIIAPLYWWKEYDTYKVGTVANSCSTMHKLMAKEFERSDFSLEIVEANDGDEVIKDILALLNDLREAYINYDASEYHAKREDIWYSLIQLLPESYNQKRTVQLNYAVLKNMYHARKNHKLKEWRTFCEWVERLPHSQLIIE